MGASPPICCTLSRSASPRQPSPLRKLQVPCCQGAHQEVHQEDHQQARQRDHQEAQETGKKNVLRMDVDGDDAFETFIDANSTLCRLHLLHCSGRYSMTSEATDLAFLLHPTEDSVVQTVAWRVTCEQQLEVSKSRSYTRHESDENREDKVAVEREEQQIMKHVNQQTNGHATCHMSGTVFPFSKNCVQPENHHVSSYMKDFVWNSLCVDLVKRRSCRTFNRDVEVVQL